MSLPGTGSPPAAQDNGGLFGNSNTNNAQTTTTTTFAFGSPAASQSPAPNSNNAQTDGPSLFGPTAPFQFSFPGLSRNNKRTTPSQDTPNTIQFGVYPPRESFKSPDYSDPFSAQAGISQVDPNGDIVLIVSRPEKPRQYSQESSSSNEKVEQQPACRRFRASSKHLILASSYFESRLSLRWPEGKLLNGQGRAELEIPDTDPDAFHIMLNLMHCRTRAVPRHVDLTQLTELAVLADYFKCHEAFGLFSSSWIDRLKGNIQSAKQKDLIKWIFISSVFGEKDLFRSVTQIAQRSCINTIDAMGLPIPKATLDAINTARVTALDAIFKIIKDRQEQLQGSPNVCTFDCDAYKLGALMKQIKSNNFNLYPKSKIRSYPGYAVSDVALATTKFEAPNKCEKCSGAISGSGFGYPSSDRNKLKPLLGSDATSAIKKLESSLEGFTLVDTPPP